MALVVCKECGKEISDRAKICPQCGVPLRFEIGCGTLFLALIFAAVLLYAGCKEMIKSQYNVIWEQRFSR